MQGFNPPPRTTQTALPLTAPWVASAILGAPTYSKDATGRVHLSGAVSSGANSAIGTLPETLRPAGYERFIVSEGASNPGILSIGPDGVISPVTLGGFDNVSLNTISFMPA